ncbi:MAG: hypothetical protein ACYDHO_05005 [Gaiellaceae bacterium]
MKLGIAVVYLVKPENDELLRLHLAQIRTMTAVPYAIFAGVRRPTPSLARLLAAEPGLKQVTLPEPGGLTGSAEHALYLEHLIERAAGDDVTHLAILHADSFPIQPDWAETIAGRLTGDAMLATLSNDHYLVAYSACLFFRRDFWGRYHPRMMLSEADRASPTYRRFAREQPHFPLDSGAGYVFRAFREGKTVVALERSDANRNRGSGGLYGDLVFHLGGAYRYDSLNVEEQAATETARFGLLSAARRCARRCVPKAFKRRLNRLAFPYLELMERRLTEQARRELLDDPERYLERLRGTG